MNRITGALAVAAAAACVAAGVALAQSQFPTPLPADRVAGVAILAPNGQTLAGQPVMGPVGITNPLPVAILPSSTTGSAAAVTVGTSSAQALPPAALSRRFLAIDNESPTATVACAFGAAAAISSAGSFTIPPQNTRTWDGTFVPSDAVNCIASAGATPVTIEAN